MHIETFFDTVEVHREDKIIFARFLEPHMVISTCRCAGGIRRDMEYVLNHQSCEPRNHLRGLPVREPEKYRRLICEPHGLPASKCVTMGTAANMHHAAFTKEGFMDLEVASIITGGVETNAGRAGDPASVYETEDGFQRLEPPFKTTAPVAGTINIMLFINRPLTEAALVRTIMMATEAKTAALQELSVNSRYSDGLATGTGTDQIIVAAPDREGYRLSWAGKHGKLGELIGLSVIRGVKETLARQNRLTPQGQCSVKILLERFGCTGRSMTEGIAGYMKEGLAQVLRNNLGGVIRDPVVVAAVSGMVHIRDRFSWGILPVSCWQEIMGAAAAQVACAVGGCYGKMEEYRERLGNSATEPDNDSFLDLCWRAMAAGFSDKWPDPPVSEEARSSRP